MARVPTVGSEDAETTDIPSRNAADGCVAGCDSASPRVELGSDAAVTQIAEAVEAGVGRVLQAFDEKLRYDTTQQAQLDRLHAELQEHRSDLLAKATRPLVYGMIRIHGDIGRVCSALRDQEKPIGEDGRMSLRFIELLNALSEDVELELEKHGVVTTRADQVVVDPKRQRVVSRTLVGEPELDGVVEASIKPGFEQGEYVLVKESVAVFKFDPTFNEGGRNDGSGAASRPTNSDDLGA